MSKKQENKGQFRSQILLVVGGIFGCVTGEAIGQEARIRPRTPVMIQASNVTDACARGVVYSLDPRDGFLAVKAGPGVRYSRIDKLYNGEQVYLCVDAGDWWGIVFTKTRRDCNVSTPWPRSLRYTGPCRSGWTHKRWIQLTAG